jgi:hypothetical protein
MDSPHRFFSNTTASSARLVVEAEFDPQLPARVLGRFAEQGQLPSSFLARNRDDTSLLIELEFAAEAETARLLSRRLQNIPSVRSVELSLLRMRLPQAA